MSGKLLEGLSVCLIGQTTVFINLIILMTVVMVLGRIFGKKKKGSPAAGGASAKDAGAGAPPA